MLVYRKCNYCHIMSWISSPAASTSSRPLLPADVFAGVNPSSHWVNGEGHAAEKSPDHHEAPVMRSVHQHLVLCLGPLTHLTGAMNDSRGA